jgi:hypothetical protein
LIKLIRLDDAKVHLNLDVCNDSDLLLKVEQASAIVMKELKISEFPAEWVIEGSSPAKYEVPADVQAATFLVLGDLWAMREGSVEQKDFNPVSSAVRGLLGGHRDPTLA